MRIRCELHIDGGHRKLVLASGPSEPDEHLALKLAALALFWQYEPTVDPSAKTPALDDYEFFPDLMGLDEAGEIRLWVECDTVTMNKMEKLTRRLPRARVVVLKTNEREAARLRSDLKQQIGREAKIEILAFAGQGFKDWCAALGERTELVGESAELSINLVVNEKPFIAELLKF
mgnify:CR=1 FL=1